MAISWLIPVTFCQESLTKKMDHLGEAMSTSINAWLSWMMLLPLQGQQQQVGAEVGR
jgi:hypothetical protein